MPKRGHSTTHSKTSEKKESENADVYIGTGIIVPNDLPLAAEIEADGLGKLSNPVKQL